MPTHEHPAATGEPAEQPDREPKITRLRLAAGVRSLPTTAMAVASRPASADGARAYLSRQLLHHAV